MAAEQTEFATEPTPVFEETASTQGDHSTLAGGSTARTSTGAVDIDPAGGQSVSTPSPNSVAPNTPTTSSADGGRDDAGSDVFFLSDDLFTNRSSSSASASTSNASERSSGLVDDDDEYEESDDPFTAAMLSALEPEQSQPAILQNLDTGEQIALHNLPFTIGSAPSNNLVVTGKQVAAKQAQIENQFQRYVIQDLTRHNNAKRNETDHPEMGGVKVNGYRVENVPLEEGDEVSIGENTFVFHPGVLVARETPDEAETSKKIGSLGILEIVGNVVNMLRRQWMVLVPLSILTYAAYAMISGYLSDPKPNAAVAVIGTKPVASGLAGGLASASATEFVIEPSENAAMPLDNGMDGGALSNIQFSIGGLDTEQADKPKPNNNKTISAVPDVPQLEQPLEPQAAPAMNATTNDPRSPLTQPAMEGQSSASARLEERLQAITTQMKLPDVSGPLKDGSAPPQGSFDYGQIFNVGGGQSSASTHASAPSANTVYDQLSQSSNTSSSSRYQHSGPSSIDVIGGTTSSYNTAQTQNSQRAMKELMGESGGSRSRMASQSADLGFGSHSVGAGMPPQSPEASRNIGATLGEDWAKVMGGNQATADTTPPPPAFDERHSNESQLNDTPPVRLNANMEDFPEFPPNAWDQPIESSQALETQALETTPANRSTRQNENLLASTNASVNEESTPSLSSLTQASSPPNSPFASESSSLTATSSTSASADSASSLRHLQNESRSDGKRMTIKLDVPIPPRSEVATSRSLPSSASTSDTYLEPQEDEPHYIDRRSDPFMELIEERLSSLENDQHPNAASRNNSVPSDQMASASQGNSAAPLQSAKSIITSPPQSSLGPMQRPGANWQPVPTYSAKTSEQNNNLAPRTSVPPASTSASAASASTPSASTSGKNKADQAKDNDQTEHTENASENAEDQARDLILRVERTYKENGAKKLLSDLRRLEKNPNVSQHLRGQLTENIERYSALYRAYTRGQKAFADGNKEEAFEQWISLLKNERSVVKQGHSLYAKEVRDIVSQEYARRAREAEENHQWAEAWRYWQSAKKFGKTAMATRKMADIEQRAQEIFDQGIDAESADPVRARNLWQEVMHMLPQSHELYAKAAAKVSWYEQWRY